MDGLFAAGVARSRVRPGVEERADGTLAVRGGGVVKRSRPAVVSRIQLRASVNEETHDRFVAALRREMKGRSTHEVIVRCVDDVAEGNALGEEFVHDGGGHLDIVAPRGVVQGGRVHRV